MCSIDCKEYFLKCVSAAVPAVMARVLPKDPDLETEDETWHTWNIQDWRKLKKKEHGPVFQCGGSPW